MDWVESASWRDYSSVHLLVLMPLQDMEEAMKGGHLVRSSIKGSSAYLVKVEESRSIKVGSDIRCIVSF